MSDTHEQRTPTEEVAARARAQTAQQVDAWILQSVKRIENTWEHAIEGRMSWREAQRQRWPGAQAAEITLTGYQELKTQWRVEVRDPTVQEIVLWEAVRKEVVTPEVAEHYMREVERSHLAEGAQSPTRPHGSLGHYAGEEAYRQTLQQEQGHSREAPSQAPAGREEPTPHAREAERSQEMAARGWGQTWDEQQHAQERGRDQ